MMLLKSILVLVPLLLSSVSGSGTLPAAEALTFSVAPRAAALQEAIEARFRAGWRTPPPRGSHDGELYHARKEWYELIELSAVHALLPGTKVHRVTVYTFSPGVPYTFVEKDSVFYGVPGGRFNNLLRAADIFVTDSNLIECAEAFLALALLSEVRPESLPVNRQDTLAVVLDAVHKRQKVAGDWHDLQLDLKVGGLPETWYFGVFRGGFGSVVRRGGSGKLRDYPMLGGLLRRGRRDTGEAIDIDALLPSYAQGSRGHATAAVTSPRL